MAQVPIALDCRAGALVTDDAILASLDEWSIDSLMASLSRGVGSVGQTTRRMERVLTPLAGTTTSFLVIETTPTDHSEAV